MSKGYLSGNKLVGPSNMLPPPPGSSHAFLGTLDQILALKLREGSHDSIDELPGRGCCIHIEINNLKLHPTLPYFAILVTNPGSLQQHKQLRCKLVRDSP